MPFNPVHILILISAAIGFYAFQTHGRRRMLSFKVLSDTLYGIYILLLGGYSGAIGVSIAVLGGMVQVVTPPRLLKKSLPYRFIIACILCVTGAYFFSKTMTDVYPFIGIIVARFAELFHSTRMIRSGFFIASGFWLIYSYSNGFYLAVAMGLLMMLSMVLGYLKNERKLPNDPIP